MVREQGMRVDPAPRWSASTGCASRPRRPRRLALNKPRGVLSTMTDDRGRPCVGDFVRRPHRAAVPRRPARRRHRGAAAAHQRRGARPPAGAPRPRGAQDLPRPGSPAHARAWGPAARRHRARRRPGPGGLLPGGAGDARPALVELVLHEGRKHVVRRMLAEVGHPVVSLVRTKVGPIALGELRPGGARAVTDEVGALYTAAGR